MKRTFALLLALCLILLTPLSASAAEIPVSAPTTLAGYLCDQNGNITEIVGELVATTVPYGRSTDYSATYLYKTPRAGGSNTTDSPDSGYSSHVYLTIHYQIQSGTFYLLTAISGYWVIQDSRVSVTSSSIDYSCGPNQTVFDRSVSNNFYVSTGFTAYTEDNGTFSNVGAHLDLTYQMGTTRTWTFRLSNIIL